MASVRLKLPLMADLAVEMRTPYPPAPPCTLPCELLWNRDELLFIAAKGMKLELEKEVAMMMMMMTM